MKISTNASYAYQHYGRKQGFVILASLGYDAVDYGAPCNQYKVNEGMFTWDAKTFEEYFREDGQYAKEAGIEIGQVHAPFPTYPESNDKKEFAYMVEAIRKSIMATAFCGSKYLVIHGAMPLGWQVHTDWEGARDINYEVLAKLIPTAQEYGVKLALENMPCVGIPTSDPHQLVEYIDMMDAPETLVACFDTGHCNITGVDCGEYVRILGKRLETLHIHDNDSRKDDHTCPYLGTVNWDGFLTALKETGYSGNFNLEADSFRKRFPEEMYLSSEAFMYSLSRDMCQKYGL